MAAGNAIEIFVFQEGKFLGSRCFSHDTITIGSSRDSSLRLRHADIAPQHALVRIEGSSVMIADNSSPTGVFVNGTRVSNRTVKSFDEVVLGPFRLKISRLGVEDEEEDPGFGAGPSTEVPRYGEHDPAEAPTALDMRQGAGLATSARGLAAPVREIEADEDAATLVRRVDQEPETLPARGAPVAQPAPSLDAAFAEADAAFGGRSTKRTAPATRAALHGAPQASLEVPGAPQSAKGATRAPAPTKRKRAEANAGLPFQDTVEHTAARASRGQTIDGTEPGMVQATAPQDASDFPLGKSATHRSATDGATDQETAFDDAPTVAPGYDWVDDDDDEEPFVEPFSLLENVIRERFKTPADVDPFITAEVIRYGDGEILDVLQAAPNRSVKLFPDDFRLLDTLGSGQARLYFHERFKGTIVRHGKARQLAKLIRPETLVDAKRGLHAVDLREGDYAQILREDAGYLVRFVNPPRTPKEKFGTGITFSWSMVQLFLGSTAFHLLVLVLLGLTGSQADLVVETEAEKFAKVAIKDLKLEKPEPKKEEPKPEPKKDPVKKQPTPVKRVKRVKQRTTPRAPTVQRQARVQQKQVSNVLTALSNLKPAGGGPARSSLSSLTNIAAVRTPTGSGVGGYKVSGVIGKIAGKGIRLATGGFGGGKGTKVGTQLLAGGKHGGLAALAGTGRRVRGRVGRAPTRSIQATGGTLSREAIQRVVGQHMHKIQACYERQLIVSPGLAGKIVFDWVISTSGSVSSARQVSSSLRNAAVANCILQQIRSWRFPQPQGGSVQVRYPFVFRQQGF